jgi:thiamine-monophosphate kinase
MPPAYAACEPHGRLGEFDLIRRFFTRGARGDVALGVGDDCALLTVPAGRQLAVSIDTLVEGVHFFPGTDPGSLGHKLLAVGLSDLAAMGAEPAWATLALTLPTADVAWLAAFSEGLYALGEAHGVQVVGGDTTRGPLTLSAQLHGLVPAGQAITRGGAHPGDDLYVTGLPGEAALAIEARAGRRVLHEPWTAHLLSRLDRPQPRVAAGLALRGLATAAIDVSDGLAADLAHILEASGVGAELWDAALPVSPALAAHLGRDQALERVLGGGDDYELCFTAPPGARETIGAAFAALGLPLVRIGRMVAGPGLRRLGARGERLPLPPGYRHFD